jgi:sugar phosphate permease
MARELGLSTPALAGIDTAFLLAYALGQLPSGLAADRAGARKLVGLGLLCSAGACALFGSVSSASLLAACFFANGLAQATGWPGTTKWMAEWTTPNERGRVMGLWSTCYQVGGVAATALATFLLTRHGWRAAFHGPSLWLAAVGVVVLWLAPARAQENVSQAPVAPAQQSPTGRRRIHIDPILYSYGACYFCIKLIRYSLLFWLPFYLHTSAGFDDALSGYLSTAFEIGGIAGSIGLGALSDRRGGSRAGAAMLSLCGLALALLAYAGVGHAGPVLHFALLALIGALLFGPDALLSGAAAQDVGGNEDAATAVGVVNGLGSAGALLQGALTVGVEQAFGWHALFYVFFALALLATLCLLPALRAHARDGRKAAGRNNLAKTGCDCGVHSRARPEKNPQE